MRAARTAFLFCLLVVVVPARGQQSLAPQNTPQTPEQASQAATLLRTSITAQNGGAAINDVTVTGNVTVARGQTTESGTIVMTAWATGQIKSTIAAASGTRSGFKDFSVTPRVGTSIGVDGTAGTIAPEDMMGPHPAWFFPQLIMASAMSSPNYASADMGQETRDGATVRHVAIWPTLGMPVKVPTLALQGFGQQDLYLDPATSLPLALRFNLRAIINPNKNITPFRKVAVYAPEEVRFSDYRQVQGRTTAFHIQVYVRKTLVMEIQLSSVNVNTGAVVSAN